jgi:predicted metal-dependent phosphoesterase TrpH
VSQTWGKADIHIHSNASDGIASIPEIMEYVQHHTDLDVIAITDHNTLDGALWAHSLSAFYDFDVVVGEEVSAREGHVIGLFLSEHIAAGMSAADTIRAIQEQGGVAVIPHPFSAKGVYGPRGKGSFAAAAAEGSFDAAEVYNSLPFLAWANKVASTTLHGGHLIAATGGSDAHVPEAVGKGYTVFRGSSAEDLRSSILRRETRAEAAGRSISLAWRYARKFRQIRRMHSLNWERCSA